MNEDSYHEDEQKYQDPDVDRHSSEQEIVDQDKSWAELQSKLYSTEAEKIADSLWRQLRCKTTTLTYNVTWVKCIYIMVAVICIPIGVITFNLSNSVVMQEFAAYDGVPACALSNFAAQEEWGKECTVNYTIEHDFDPPIYFHYKLTNFYQNHRSYVKSRSEKQLLGEELTDVDSCDPSDVQTSHTVAYSGHKMLPCGLIANSFFNDKYKVTLFPADGSTAVAFCDSAQCGRNEQEAGMAWSNATWYASPNWEKSDIAWKSDIKGKFEETQQIDGETTDVNTLQNWQNVTLPNTGDQDFIVWMRTAATSKFTKLHRIIRGQALKKGDILQVSIRNYFNVNSFQGSKALVITTNSELGGKNHVLGIAYMVMGSLCLLTAVCFRLLIPPQKLSPLHEL
eukprot:CAMPEP_0197021694 /NCGR_PEP_ID=MMETSP1384-20130603/2636_1 /TAXON_ID=29189 /ORGANISM="Ammonia sp." /LENGTH=395 /DNA_ID=CAMNT_0042449583 /DNA_START=44 /DNA_END=1231 /DNA_ORIENTATION=-